MRRKGQRLQIFGDLREKETGRQVESGIVIIEPGLREVSEVDDWREKRTRFATSLAKFDVS